MTKFRWAGHLARKGEMVNVYRVLVRNETHGRLSGRWKLILKNLSSYIKKILNWLPDLNFVAEDRDK